MIDVTAEIEARMDPAAFDYLDEIRALAGEYERDGREITARYSEISDECAARLEAAKSERWREARALNDEYRKRAAKIACDHMDRAEHPDEIAAALGRLDATIGGACRDSVSFYADDARAAIHSAVKKRIDHEEAEKKTRRWAL